MAESGSFVEDDLRQYFSDVLYSLETAEGTGYVHVLIEHQSSPDVHMAFRMTRYAVAAMQRPLEAGHKKLPAAGDTSAVLCGETQPVPLLHPMAG